MSPLPRGTCPACGKDVAIRTNGATREHVEYLPGHNPPANTATRICSGSGQQVAR